MAEETKKDIESFTINIKKYTPEKQEEIRKKLKEQANSIINLSNQLKNNLVLPSVNWNNDTSALLKEMANNFQTLQIKESISNLLSNMNHLITNFKPSMEKIGVAVNSTAEMLSNMVNSHIIAEYQELLPYLKEVMAKNEKEYASLSLDKIIHFLMTENKESEKLKQVHKLFDEAQKLKDKRENEIYIKQGTATNAITKLNKKSNYNSDPMIDKATAVCGGVIITVKNLNSLKGKKWDTSTSILFDTFISYFTQTNNPTINIRLRDYMKLRGLKHYDAAKAQVIKDLEILLRTSITSFKDKIDGEEIEFSGLNITDSCEFKRGRIIFTFASKFAKYLFSRRVMYYPKEIAQININNNHNSYYFGRKIAEHKNMNIGKSNENIISVDTLLAVSTLPTYEEVMKGNGNVTDRIIDPFSRDMDALKEMLTWEFCNSNGTPLTAKELAADYATFKKSLVKIIWKYYPDQTKRLEKIEQARKIKKTKTIKKKKSKNQAE